jgi:DivIVA domain-containing protein
MFNEQPIQARFALGLRGYDPAEVDSHLRALEVESANLKADLLESGKAVKSLAEELGAARREIDELQQLLADLLDKPDGDQPCPPLDGVGRCVEAIVRTSREQAEQLRSEAQSIIATKLDQARDEALHLVEEATDRRAHAVRLQDEAEADRAQAAEERADAFRQVGQARERAEEAAREMQSAVNERDGVLEQLQSLAASLDQWLNNCTVRPAGTGPSPGEAVGE